MCGLLTATWHHFQQAALIKAHVSERLSELVGEPRYLKFVSLLKLYLSIFCTVSLDVTFHVLCLLMLRFNVFGNAVHANIK